MDLSATTKNCTAPDKSDVQTMFDRFAKSYDFLNHFFSLHIDKLWRIRASNELREQRPLDKVLDVATGTADFAIAIQKRLQPAHIVGVDISEGMLAIGREKIKKKKLENNISLKYGDSTALPFDEQTFDAVTVGFGVRNFEHIEKGISEMYRVLKCGRKIVILELSIPRNQVVRGIYNFYFFRIVPFLGRLLSKDKYAYNYLPESVHFFQHGEEFKKKLENSGFRDVKIKSLTFGIASIYTGIKN